MVLNRIAPFLGVEGKVSGVWGAISGVWSHPLVATGHRDPLGGVWW